MASQPLTPVQMIDETQGVTLGGGRALLEFSSYGAPVRMSLSRNGLLSLYYDITAQLDELLAETSECEVIAFPKRRA